jgi:hypothetical protein
MNMFSIELSDLLSTTPISIEVLLPRISFILLKVLSTLSLNGSQIKIRLGLLGFDSHSGEDDAASGVADAWLS